MRASRPRKTVFKTRAFSCARVVSSTNGFRTSKLELGSVGALVGRQRGFRVRVQPDRSCFAGFLAPAAPMSYGFQRHSGRRYRDAMKVELASIDGLCRFRWHPAVDTPSSPDILVSQHGSRTFSSSPDAKRLKEIETGRSQHSMARSSSGLMTPWPPFMMVLMSVCPSRAWMVRMSVPRCRR